MKKQTSHAFNKDCYLLGKDENGIYYWLEQSTFDCGWYWSIGYVETYTNNQNPSKARDIDSHQHFNGLFKDGKHNMYDNFKSFFVESTVSDKELWTLCELMQTLYTMREYADTCNRGGSHFTQNPCADLIKSLNGEQINTVVMPALFEELYKLLK